MKLAITLRPGQYRLDSRLESGRRRVIEDPDGELVVRVAAGEAAAARALMARHLPKILNLARRLLGDAVEAEDVAQDAFMRVWTHAARWRPGQAKFETWLHRVALNLCYDRLRRRPTAPIEDVPEFADRAPGPAAKLFEAQIAAIVDAALKRLPDRQREALVLCHYQGLTNIDAAQVMEVSIEALESLLSRARRTLKTTLEPLRIDVFQKSEDEAAH